MQRLTKYPLLLENIIKHTEGTDWGTLGVVPRVLCSRLKPVLRFLPWDLCLPVDTQSKIPGRWGGRAAFPAGRAQLGGFRGWENLPLILRELWAFCAWAVSGSPSQWDGDSPVPSGCC